MDKSAGFYDTLPKAIRSGLGHVVREDTPAMSMGIGRFLATKLKPWAANESKALSSAANPWYKKIVSDKFISDRVAKTKDALMGARRKAFDEGYWKRIGEPILKADINLGQKAGKLTGKIFGKSGENFWTHTKDLQLKAPSTSTLGKMVDKVKEKVLGPNYLTGVQRVRLPSLMAPVTKASAFAIPIAGGIKIQELLGKKHMDENKNKVTQADLKKTAAMLRCLKDQKNFLEKKARATSILYKQAEMGHLVFPRTVDEYEEKVAELIGRDLNVVEEAIKLASPNFNSLGNLVQDTAAESGSPREVFQRSLLAEY